MSRNQRIGVVVAALLVAVVAFLVAQPGGDDDGEQADNPAPAETAVRETTPQTTEEAPPPEPAPVVRRIRVQDGTPVGGMKKVEASKGDVVRIVVTSDTADEFHLHGYDITREAAPGKPARFSFSAGIEGVFELESHHSGQVVAQVVIEPS